MNEEEVKRVIVSTLNEVGKQKVGVKLTRPETMQGWLALILTIVTVSTVFWKSFSFIHVVSKHHDTPHPIESKNLVNKIEQLVVKHIEGGNHHHDSDLNLKIIKQTEPMKRDIEVIQRDVGAIRARVEVLLERKFLDRHQK
jgi:hypothetical protein